ncbi:MAG: type III-B CRISPR module RAMP protein Cmr6 [bacterium]
MRFLDEQGPFSDRRPNLGLFYFKYTPKIKKWDKQKKKYVTDDKKLAKFFSDFLNHKVSHSIVEKRIEIYDKLADISICMRNKSNFLVGSGYVNTTEWGLSFDWTSGLPYMPGSSFKGALLSFLEFCNNGIPVEYWGMTKKKAKKKNSNLDLSFLDNDTDCIPIEVKLPKIGANENYDFMKWTNKEITKVFGPQDDAGQCLGGYVFLDVLPLDFNSLTIDIITPHYGDYYKDPEHNPPADIYAPKPNQFLAVAPGSTYCFFIKKLPHCDVRAEKVEKLVELAGEFHGFGSKTSSGYGIFE